MNKKEFQDKTLINQVNYYNEKMKQGQSLSKISKEIGISKSISSKFKSHGYNLINGKLILSQIEGQENLFNITPQEKPNRNTLPVKEMQYIAVNREQPQKIIKHEVNTNISALQTTTVAELKKGRPTRPGRLKTNITLDAKVKEELQIYCIKQRIALSDLLERLAVEFLQR